MLANCPRTDPVVLCNDLGAKRDQASTESLIPSSGHGSMSIKEAVRIAQSNNFMGLVCNSALLVSPPFSSSSSLRQNPADCFAFNQRLVPALIDAIKTAGLVLITDTSEETPRPTQQSGGGTPSSRIPDGVDGILRANGVLRFNGTVDM